MIASAKFLLFWVRCRSCGYEYQTLSDPGDGRYRLLLSSRTGRPALVDTLEDPAFSEVYRFVEEVLPARLSTAQKSEIFDQVFGLICDPDCDGSHYDMSGKRRCTRCGSTLVDFGPTNPPQYSEVIPQLVTHKHWDTLTEQRKQKEILKLVAVVRNNSIRPVSGSAERSEGLTTESHDSAKDCEEGHE